MGIPPPKTSIAFHRLVVSALICGVAIFFIIVFQQDSIAQHLSFWLMQADYDTLSFALGRLLTRAVSYLVPAFFLLIGAPISLLLHPHLSLQRKFLASAIFWVIGYASYLTVLSMFLRSFELPL